jgi:hypothetical protein
MKMGQSVPKGQHIKFRHQGITQKKTYQILRTDYSINQPHKTKFHVTETIHGYSHYVKSN